jgi:hypothetical protein
MTQEDFSVAFRGSPMRCVRLIRPMITPFSSYTDDARTRPAALS